MENRDGQTTGGRNALARNCAAAAGAETATAAVSGAQTGGRPAGADGDCLRAEDRHRLGGPAAGAGLRQRYDLLAADAGVVGGRGVGSAANRLGPPAGPGGQNQLVAGRGGLQQCAGGFWGTQTGPSPVDRAK